MEQSKLNKILIFGFVMSFVLSLTSIILVLKSKQELRLLGDTSGIKANSIVPAQSNQIVDSGPVKFESFVGKVNSEKVENMDGKKIIELVGHKKDEPSTDYESVQKEDREIRKIILDEKSEIYYIDDFLNHSEPKEYTVADVENNSKNTYVAYYESPADENIDEKKPVNILVVYGPAKKLKQ